MGCSRREERHDRHGSLRGSLHLWVGSHQGGHHSRRAWEEHRSLRRGHHDREGRRDHRHVRRGSCQGGLFAWGQPVISIVSVNSSVIPQLLMHTFKFLLLNTLSFSTNACVTKLGSANSTYA
jgi:hypothetical protein